MRCPFWPLCDADLTPIAQRKAPDTLELEYVYPRHEVVGEGSWYGTCPATSFLIIGWPSPRWRTTAAAGRVIVESSKRYLSMLAERGRWSPEAPGGTPLTGEELGLTLGFGPGEFQVPGSQTAPPETSDYFPGRPADAPEPGPGESVPPAPMDVGGGFLGRAEVDNSRDQLKGMVSMTISSIDRSQGHLARMIAAVEVIEGLAVTAETQSDATMALARAAVGGGGALPEPADRMLANLNLVRVRVASADDGLLPALALLRGRLDAAQQTYTAAREAATDYLALP
jgi:hypothetical protein